MLSIYLKGSRIVVYLRLKEAFRSTPLTAKTEHTTGTPSPNSVINVIAAFTIVLAALGHRTQNIFEPTSRWCTCNELSTLAAPNTPKFSATDAFSASRN